MQEKEFTFKNFFVPLTTTKAIIFIVLIGFIVFLNSLFNNFIGDDYTQIVVNPVVHDIGNIVAFFSGSTFSDSKSSLTGIYYKPILTLVNSLIYTFFGTWTFPYHLIQLTLHILNSILLLFIFKKYIKTKIAFALSIIFLIHPINNEAVVFIAALQEPLFLFFGLTALFLTQQLAENRYRLLSITIVLLLSMLSKETGILFVIVLPLYLGIINRKYFSGILASCIAFFVYLTLRIGVAHIYINSQNVYSNPFMQVSFYQRLLNIPKVFFFYIYTFAFPKDLLVYQRWIVSSINFNNFYFPLIVNLLFILLLIACILWVHKYAKKQFGVFLFFFVWFALGLGIHLQIIPLDYTVADRWFYFPIIGLLGMIGILINLINFRQKYEKTMLVFFIAIIVIFSLRNIVRNLNWKNTYTLSIHDIQLQQDNYAIQSLLGVELYNQGRYEEAKKHLLTSIKIHPNIQNLTALGYAYMKLKDIPNAKNAFIKALNYKKIALAYQALVKTMSLYDDPQTAKSFINKYLKYFPNDPVLWLYLSVADYRLGSISEALSEIEKSYNLQPSQEAQYVFQKITNNEPIELINDL
jgi:protein O-mannosyl-transferase